MTPLEKTSIDLIRLGLKGDSASVRQLAARILRSSPRADGEDAEFREAVARLLVAHDSARRISRGAPKELRPPGEAGSSMLVHVEEPSDAPVPFLADQADRVLRQIIDERLRPELLARAGLQPTRTLLLTGAPGVGKTMAARYLASSLKLPLMVVDLAALVSSFLGKTGQNLRLVLDHARTTRCVLLIDEFDALGKRRDDPADVGELKRLVNILLLELENWPSSTLLVAATNHPELLDRAVWRRFECVLAIELPDSTVRAKILHHQFESHGIKTGDDDFALCVEATAGASGSDLHRFVNDVVRSSALRRGEEVEESLVEAVLARLLASGKHDKHARGLYCWLASFRLRLNQREIARRVGLSHVAVGKLVKRESVARSSGEVARKGFTRIYEGANK